MSAAGRHPDLLAYVAGLLPADENAEVRTHLGRCEACRDEERALRSLRRSLRSAPAGGHPSVEDLVAHEDGAPRDSLAGHVARCAECRADLEALAQVRRGGQVAEFGKPRARGRALEGEGDGEGEEATPFRPRGARRVARGLLAAGLAASLLGGGWLIFRLRPPAPRPEANPVVLSPATRGETGERAIVAGASTRLRIVLPFGAPGGRYETRLESANGLEIVAQTSVVKNGEILEVRFEAPDRPGEYRLAVLSLDATNATPILYPLRVVAGAPTPPRQP